MYINFGSYNFFEHGVLVDAEHSDTIFDILRCEPYDDEDDLFMFAHLQVNIEDERINRPQVMSCIGMTEATFDPIQYAIACTNYYDWDHFGAADIYQYNWQQADRETIERELNNYLIASDNLDMPWKGAIEMR